MIFNVVKPNTINHPNYRSCLVVSGSAPQEPQEPQEPRDVALGACLGRTWGLLKEDRHTLWLFNIAMGNP